MAYCTHCGVELASDARFCSNCGAVASRANERPSAEAPRPERKIPPPAAAPASPKPPSGRDPRGRWWIAPALVVGVVVVAWLVLAGLPFGGEERKIPTVTPTDTIAEGTAPPAQPGTVVDVGGPAADSTNFDFQVTETQPPPLVLPDNSSSVPAPRPVPPPMTSASPAPVPRETRPAESAKPAPPVSKPEPRQEAPRAEPEPAPARQISEGQAAAALRRSIARGDYYEGVRGDCLQVRGSGYVNEGYGFSVWDACIGGGASRRLGVWRVDAHTGEVFVQGPGGKYGRP